MFYAITSALLIALFISLFLYHFSQLPLKLTQITTSIKNTINMSYFIWWHRTKSRSEKKSYFIEFCGNIAINKYLLLRANHPKNIKQEGVHLYFKELLPLIKRHELSNKKECLVTKVNVKYEKIKSSQQVKIPMS